jgi:two-component system, sensor histidine kinase
MVRDLVAIARPETADTELERRLGSAQAEALVGYIPVSAVAVGLGAAILAGALAAMGYVDQSIAAVWAAYILLSVLAHLTLFHLYRRNPLRAEHWRRWTRASVVINFFVGLGVGVAPAYLARDSIEVQFIVLLLTLSIAAGSVPNLSPHLPTFLAFFLPATLPFAVASAFAPDPLVSRLGPILIPIFIAGEGGLGLRSNRSFTELVGLQIRTEKMAEELGRQKEIAEQASRAKSAFLAAASHDLRQPVHALGLFVGALRGVSAEPEAIRLIGRIEDSIEAMDALFNALLDISRLDAGVVEVRRRPFAIRATIERVRRDYAADAEAKRLRLVWIDCAAIVDSDPVLIERVLRNLVSNAVRYTDRGKILVGCRRRGREVAVQVWDTGTGIPPEEQARVFQEYHQLHNPERDRSKGLGLGLAIVQRLSVLLGCPVTLRSAPGKGSCFELLVPASSVPAAEQPAPPAEPQAVRGRFIVVVDDELPIREAMTALLRSWGHRAVAAGSGDEAIERLADCPERPDLIICDYRLRAGENGVAAIERLRSEYNEMIPAMLITGDTAPGRLAEANASGLLLLHKPVSNSKLRAAIVHLIAAGADNDALEDAPVHG